MDIADEDRYAKAEREKEERRKREELERENALNDFE